MLNAPQISQIGDPVLRRKAGQVDARDIGTTDFRRLVEAMIGAMRAGGVGLAAPQIGTPLQVIVMEDPAEYSAKMPEAERIERLDQCRFVPDIADRLVVGRSTIKFHVSSILGKLGVQSRTEAVAMAVQHKLVS